MTDNHEEMVNGRDAAAELEQRRIWAQKMREMIRTQLTADAIGMETAAQAEKDIQKRHQLMDTAKCLRVTIGWMGDE